MRSAATPGGRGQRVPREASRPRGDRTHAPRGAAPDKRRLSNCAGTRPLLAFSLLLALVFSFAERAHADGPIPPPPQERAAHAPGEVLIKFKPTVNASLRGQVRGELGAVRRRLFRSGAEHWRLGPDVSTEMAVARLRRHPLVEYVEPNYLQHALRVPDDPRYPELWGLHNAGQTGGTAGADISAEPAWDVTIGSRSVLVAVIDSGIDYTHLDLTFNIHVNPGEIPANDVDDDQNGYVDDVHGWDFINKDNNPFDDLGHGTHVAGTIGAEGNNQFGLTGVNWEVGLVPLKFLSDLGIGSNADAIEAIDYATRYGVHIINASWGGGPYSQALFEAINGASEAGILFVTSAGNDAADNDLVPKFPAGYDVPGIISVAATDENDALAPFSNRGASTVDLAAPGVSVLSTVPFDEYALSSGTSMAAPHVAGAAALIRSIAPRIDVAVLKQKLLASVDVVPGLAGQTLSGGRLNVFRAMADFETIPPGASTDLAVVSPTSFSLTLTWTATGDDGDAGTASRYDIRYSSSPFDETGFASASPVIEPPDPIAAGGLETLEVRGLTFSTTYYFALMAIDEWGNPGPMSNLASGTTLGTPDVGVAPEIVSAEVFTGGVASRGLTIENTGVGHLVFDLSIRAPGDTIRDVPQPDIFRSDTARPLELALEPQPVPPSGPAYDGGSAPLEVAPDMGEIHVVSANSGSLDILLLHNGADVTEIRRLLLTLPGVARVDSLDALRSPPALATLLAYEAVIVISKHLWADPDATGDVLADYADAGGGVVLTLASFYDLFSIRGRFEAQGYHPLLGVAAPIGSSSLGEYDAAHPIMGGVSAASGTLLASAQLAPGAEWVASWDFGQPFVATKGANVVAVNIYVADTGRWTGDVPLILRNAAFWSSQITTWLTAAPVSGVVPPGGRLEVAVTFDAAGLVGGDYDTDIVIATNDPDEPETLVPARLHVTGAPDISASGEEVTLESVRDYLTSGATTVHTFNATIPPEGAGVLELIADGDYGDADETATAVAEGLNLGTVGGTNVDCTMARNSFTIGDADLAALAADGVIQVEVRNSLFVGAFCPVSRHTLRLSYSARSDTFDFGAQFIGVAHARSLVVENLGTGVLSVTGIAADEPAYVVEASSFVLNPGEKRVVGVTFVPDREGSFPATLTLTSNDPDEGTITLSLRGAGVGAPDVAVAPASLGADLVTGQSQSRTLDILNTGLSDLHVEVRLRPSAPPPGVADASARLAALRLESAGSALPPLSSERAPEGFVSLQSAPALIPGATVLIIQNVRPWNTTTNEQILSARGLLYDVIGVSQVAGTDLSAYKLVIVPSDQTTTFYGTLAGRADQLSAYVAAGGVLEFHAAGWGFANGNASLVPLPGGMLTHQYFAGTNRVLAPDHPLMDGVPNPFVGNYASHSYFSHIPANAARITDDGTGRPNLVVYRFGRGTVLAAGQTLELGNPGNHHPAIILRNLIPYAYSLAPNWLLVDPPAAVVPPGGRLEAAVTFDAAGLVGGDYDTDIVIATNDPDEPETLVPARLHVTGAPDVALFPDRLDFGDLFIGASRSLPLTVINNGTEILTAVFEAHPPEVSIEPSQLALAPGERRDAIITLRPALAGPFQVALTLLTNDPDEGTVSLHITGTGLVAPVIGLSPSSLEADLSTGQVAGRTLTLQNSGGSVLTFQAAIAPAHATWLTVTPSSGSLPPGGLGDLAVAFLSEGLPPGIYEAFLAVTSNDPMTPRIEVPATLMVIPDTDHDGIFDPADNCPTSSNPAQEDVDEDGKGDACDNCVSVANADQADSNRDGSGNACQPAIALHQIVADGGEILEVRAEASDPQGDPLLGSVEAFAVREIVLPDALDCAAGFLPDGIVGAGIGFAFGSIGEPFLFDLDSTLGCGDVSPDYLLASGSCDQPPSDFGALLPLASAATPITICMRRMAPPADSQELLLLRYDQDSATLQMPHGGAVFRIDFTDRLPRQTALGGLESGSIYRLAIAVTDGVTIPVTADASFLYQGETRLVINNPPRSVPAAPIASECDRPGGALLTLDGSASADPDSQPGTQDDLAGFEWLRDPGMPTEQSLGSGAILALTLPLGTHQLGLRVTDSFGESDMGTLIVSVQDTIAPVLDCPASAFAECAGPDGAHAILSSTVTDACDPDPRIKNDRTPAGRDGSGLYPLGTTYVNFTAEDASGNVAACATAVTISDSTPPALLLDAAPRVLWPPDHSLRPIRISWRAEDRCDPAPSVALLEVMSSEPGDAPGGGDGQTLIDISGADLMTSDGDLLVRAERAATGTGRTYDLRYLALDGSGNGGAATASILVPRDRDGPPDPMVLHVEPLSPDGRVKITWPAVPEALAYDVIAGDLSALRIVGDVLSLGSVRVLARGTIKTHAQEAPGAIVPSPGRAIFYLARTRDAFGGVGYGAESAPWPRIPDACEGGCP